MNRYSSILLLLCLLVLPLYIGCTTDNPLDPGNSSTEYTGSNGIVFNGAGYSNVTAEFATETFSNGGSSVPLTITMPGLSTAGDPVSVVLTLADSTTGAKTWQSQTGFNSLTGNGAAVGIGSATDTQFFATSGQTSISIFNSSTISGSFSGTLKNFDGSKTIDVNGKFTVTR